MRRSWPKRTAERVADGVRPILADSRVVDLLAALLVPPEPPEDDNDGDCHRSRQPRTPEQVAARRVGWRGRTVRRHRTRRARGGDRCLLAWLDENAGERNARTAPTTNETATRSALADAHLHGVGWPGRDRREQVELLWADEVELVARQDGREDEFRLQ